MLLKIFCMLLTLSIFNGQLNKKNLTHQNRPHYYCYTTDDHKLQRQYYSLETPHPHDHSRNYEIPGKNLHSHTKLFIYNNMHTVYLNKDCYPTKIWLVTRHGTRYPARTDTRTIAKFLPYVR